MFNRTEDWCEVVTTPGYSSFCKCFSSYKCKYLSLFKPKYQKEEFSSYDDNPYLFLSWASRRRERWCKSGWWLESRGSIIWCTYYTEFIFNHLMYLVLHPDYRQSLYLQRPRLPSISHQCHIHCYFDNITLQKSHLNHKSLISMLQYIMGTPKIFTIVSK